MESNDVPDGWSIVPGEYGLSAFAIFRDTDGGRQVIQLDNGRFELHQQGREGMLAISDSMQDCLDAAERYKGFRAFRIANMDQAELTEYAASAVWLAIACLSDPTQSNVQKARNAISNVETIMTALRVRCAQKDPAGLEDINVKADTVAAETRFAVLSLYARLSDGDVVGALDALEGLDTIVSGVADDVDDVRATMLAGEENGSN